MKAKLKEFMDSMRIYQDTSVHCSDRMEVDGSPKIAAFYRGECNAYENALLEFERIFKDELNDT